MTRACLVFGCGDPVTTRGRCARHAGQVDTQRSLGTDRQAGAGLYQSARWKALRLRLLTRHPICMCAECVVSGIVRETSVVHHLQPHGGDPAKFFKVTNLQPLAKHCHDKLTAKARSGQRGDITSEITGRVTGCTPCPRAVRVSGGSTLGADVAKGASCG